MSETHQYAGVAMNLPLHTVFTYRIPKPLQGDRIRPGCRVEVPFGAKRTSGIVVELLTTRPAGIKRMRAIVGLAEPAPVLSEEMLRLAEWMSDFYSVPIGEVLECVSPPPRVKLRESYRLSLAVPVEEATLAASRLKRRAKRQSEVLSILCERSFCSHAEFTKNGVPMASLRSLASKGLVRMESNEGSEGESSAEPFELNAFQAQAVDRVNESISANGFKTFLLYGVTGSGKTEVYLRVISEVVARGGQAIVLVPEIALTPQTIGRFRSRFPRLAVLHSAMSGGLRRRQWDLAASGKADVVVGARSGVFAPLPNLKLIVIDEEHEPSYKQESSSRYHAREVALMRCRDLGATVVLGSATPSLESYENARKGKYDLLRLPERVSGARLPEVKIVDMAEEVREQGRNVVFSRSLERSMRASLEGGKQVLLFLNRRGFHVFGRCRSCLAVVRCPHCDVALKYHKSAGLVKCHLCGWSSEPSNECPECGRPSVSYGGSGTERIEDVLAKLFPGARVARMDSDTLTKRNSHGEVLTAFRAREYDILLGTQMVAKGLDYPNITTVGVVDADVSLAFPDIRASERTFQLLSQVAGRTGRGLDLGTVVIQTSQPDSPAVLHAARHDFESFAAEELEERELLGYPPYGWTCRYIARSKHPHSAHVLLRGIRDETEELRERYSVDARGPTQAHISKSEDQFRHHMLFKTPRLKGLLEINRFVRSSIEVRSGVHLAIDMNPYNML
ncbi:MAG: primosomal protein N' [Planctomycetota bacterium]|nr:primosomal protein N' [Planctomycetota bacterium]